MTDQEILVMFQDSVREVDNNVKIGDLTATTELSSLGLDSVMTMEVIGVMEEKLDVRFPDEDLATLSKMGDLTALIHRLK